MLEALEKAIHAATGNRKFFDAREFPWVAGVESHWRSMRVELDRLLNAIEVLPGFEEIQVEQMTLSRDRRWKLFPLFGYGQWTSENGRRCPQTAQALKAIPGLEVAMFSIMQANKDLPPHRGIFSGVLRYHLGLKIPKPENQCGICVDGITAHWEEGKSLIFDDGYLHHAWNHSNEDRIILLVDFVRPLPAQLGGLNEMVLADIRKSNLVLNATEKWRRWEAAYGGRLDEMLAQGERWSYQ
jgi:beta-hydroxylase